MKRSLKQSAWTPKSFPFYAETVQGVQGESRALHWHRELEISRIRRGTARQLINGREYEAREGDIFLIDNDEIHLLFDEPQNLQVQVLLFDPALVCTPGADLFDQEYLRPFSGETGGYASRLPADGPGMEEMRRCLDEMEWQFRFHGADSALMIKAMLLQFLALVVRHYGSPALRGEKTGLQEAAGERERQRQRNATRGIRLAMDFIEADYAQPISLVRMTEIAGMSVSHFCSTFRKLTNTTPNEFLIRCRLAAAKEKLRATDDKILEIAQSCGFETLSNFNRAFLNHVGMTPGEYRRS